MTVALSNFLPHLSDEQRFEVAQLYINYGKTAKQIAEQFRGPVI